MTLAERLIAELQHEAVPTRRLLERVPDDKLSWKPHPKSMSLGQLSYHIANLPRAIATLLAEPVGEIPTVQLPGDTPSAKLIALLDSGIETAVAALRAWGDEGLAASWTMKRGGKTILEIPRIGGVRAIMLNHWYHHRGQLTVYLRLLDVPLPAIYGSSADDQPFA